MVLISPFAQKMRNGMPNPKSPPAEWWQELLAYIDVPVVQIGVEGEPALVPDFRKGLRLIQITALVRECQTWVSPDSFLPHLAHHANKPGVVVWSRSDPRLFGYPENHNILWTEKYLRKNPFGMWEEESFITDAFPIPSTVSDVIKTILIKAA